MKRDLVKFFLLGLFLCFSTFLISRPIQASDPAIQCGDCHRVHLISDSNHQAMESDPNYPGVGGCIGCHSNLHPVSFPTPSFLTGICSTCHLNNGVTHPDTTVIPAPQCDNCHYVHLETDALKTQISQPIHELAIVEDPGCVPECHPADGGYPPPGATANVCVTCHTSTNIIHPDSNLIIINVGTGGAYKTIQSAINLTTPGKTINVLAGTYNENVIVNKTLTLKGAGINTVFVSALDSTDDVFEIAADSVNISGFNISGATGNNKSGIYVNGYSGANNSNVSQNKISGNYFGIFASNSNNSVFDNNNLYANLWGLYASPITNVTISNNIADSNTQNGITLINGSVNNLLKGNAVSNNTGTGIVLRMNCGNNTLVDNILFNNGTGLNLNIMSFAPDANNVIYHNNIIGNGTPVTDNNPADNMYYSPSLLEGNYWSNYYGDDDGSGTGKHAVAGDGIGDSLTPHPAEFFDFYPFTIENGWLNLPPVLDPVGSRTVNENEPVMVVLTGIDPDGGALTFTAAGLPAGAVFNGATFNWTPDYSQSGTYTVTFTATDGSLTDSEPVTITVINVNRAPVLDPTGSQTVNENQPLQFTLTGNDPDGDPLTYSAAGLPAGAVFNGATFNWTPDYSQSGIYTVIFTVTDGSLTDSESISITVNNIPDLPILAPSNLKAVRSIANLKTVVILSWLDNSSNESGFKVERKISNRASWSQIATVGTNVNTYTDTTGKKGYSYRIRAYNSDGDSAYSNTVTVK